MKLSKIFHTLANPGRYMKLSTALFPVFSLLCVVCFAAGLYDALVLSPADYQQGEMVRIMYVHVPAAWMALLVYLIMGVLAVLSYIHKHLLADYAMKAAAPIGAAFTLITLLTGMLWGKPVWGAAWVWDARLTSVLILFFFYLGYLALIHGFEHPETGLKAGRVLVLIGLVNLPIIKFSVEWWSTLHQPASLSPFKPSAIDPAMLRPLLVMAAAYFFFFLVVLHLRLKSGLASRKRHQQRI